MQSIYVLYFLETLIKFFQYHFLFFTIAVKSELKAPQNLYGNSWRGIYCLLEYTDFFHVISAELILEWSTEASTMQGRFGRAKKFGESTGNMISEPLKKLDNGTEVKEGSG